MEVKEIKLEFGCMGTSTPRVVHSTAFVEGYMAEMVGWMIGNDIEVQNTREKV